AGKIILGCQGGRPLSKTQRCGPPRGRGRLKVSFIPSANKQVFNLGLRLLNGGQKASLDVGLDLQAMCHRLVVVGIAAPALMLGLISRLCASVWFAILCRA